MHAPKRKEALHEPQGAAGILPVEDTTLPARRRQHVRIGAGVARFVAKSLRWTFCWSLVEVVTLCPAFAQEARLVNAQMQTRAVVSSLEKEFQSLVRNQTEPAWIGYAVPVVAGNHRICCYSSEDRHKPSALRHGRCKLEGRDDGMNFQDNHDDKDASPDQILVLFRVEDKSVGKIRVFTDDCELDAGNLPVHWLTNVKPKESIALLAEFVGGTGEMAERRKSESAVTAIALHADSAADPALEKFVDPKRSEEVRKNTAFWLGNVRGRKGYEILRRMVRDDPSDKVREQCVFALHVSKVPEAVNTIIELARTDKSAHVRGQALFWLSQKAGQTAAAAIADAIENDPETDVKKKAVFALSQLPKDQGVPKLIDVARKNRNKDVRKDAMFWLGQSNDPRALDFFEEVLTK
jgi:HEAT repeat protein